MNWIIILSIWTSYYFGSMNHALYLSVVEVEITDHQIDLEIKVFADDLIDALRNQNELHNSKIDALDSIELSAYFNQEIRIVQDGHDLELLFLKSEQNGDSYFIKFRVDDKIDISLDCSFGYFFELFPEQQNIVKVKNRNESRYLIFKSKDQVESITLGE